nr:MAG TPA: Heterocyst differentiation control protein [Caudoviricetes sp.]
MLVKNENEWCWVIDGCVGYPEKSIEDCVNDFAKTYPAEEVPMIRVGNPYYYVPTVNAERVIDEIVYGDLDDEIAEYSEDYLLDVKKEHIQELENELTKVFRAWCNRHGYHHRGMFVENSEPYHIKREEYKEITQ